jgi:hypothetical protein
LLCHNLLGFIFDCKVTDIFGSGAHRTA